MTDRLSTGMGVVDRRLGGGLPPGTLLAVAAPPDSGSEQLLRAVVDAHGGRYLTLLRTEAELDGETPTSVEASHVRPEGLLGDPDGWIGDISDGSVVVVDPVNELESGPADDYMALLSRLKHWLAETGSIGVLHCLRTATEPANRWLTLGRADWVWHLELTRLPLSVETRLYVTKSRRGRSLPEPLKLELLDGVRVDTSRDI